MTESVISQTYSIINLNGLNIIQQDNDVIDNNLQSIHDYFKKYPNIKCVYGDTVINYQDKQRSIRTYLPSFDMSLINSETWKPVLFFHSIELDIINKILEKTYYNLAEIVKSILKQTFIHHIPKAMHTRNE